jgi:DNA invertase Pin-like site-specific DNA recombinase
VGRAYAGSHGWVEVCAEIDAGRSGMSTIGRLGLEHVLELAHQRAIDVVLVDQLHRLSRDARELSMLIDELHRCNVVVCTVAEGVIKEDGVSLLMQPMIEAHFYKSLRRTRQFSRKTGQKNRSARTCRHCGQEMYSQ